MNRRRLLSVTGGLLLLAAVWAGWRYWPREPFVALRVEGAYRVIVANGLPDHPTGHFPNPNDPFAIRFQRHRFRMPADPRPADQPTPIGFWQFGVAVNGVPFDPAGPFWKGDQQTGWEFEVLAPQIRGHLGVDANNAHVQPGGGYHYHGVPHGLLRRLEGDSGPRMTLLGYAADGFPVYGPTGHDRADDPTSPLRLLRPSYRLRTGDRDGGPGGRHDGAFVQDYEYIAGLGDLDECNGRTGKTPEYPEGIYHYHLTEAFPFIPRFYRGTPDRSFKHPGDGPGLGAVPPGLRRYPDLPPPRPVPQESSS